MLEAGGPGVGPSRDELWAEEGQAGTRQLSASAAFSLFVQGLGGWGWGAGDLAVRRI